MPKTVIIDRYWFGVRDPDFAPPRAPRLLSRLLSAARLGSARLATRPGKPRKAH